MAVSRKFSGSRKKLTLLYIHIVCCGSFYKNMKKTSNVSFELMTVSNPLPKVKRSVFDYRRADFEGLRAYLRSINLEEKISDHGDINQDLSDWKNAFSELVKMFVPVKNLNGRKVLPWMNNTILDLIKKKIMARNFGHACAVNIQTWENLKQYGYTKL